jgi:bifunctional non-homologous end joining protein LigD
MDLKAYKMMLATSAPIRDRPGWVYELKYDGYRILAGKDVDGTQLLSRNGYDATTWYPDITDALSTLPGSWVIDGEVCYLVDGIPDFERLQGVRGRGIPVAYFAFDLLMLNGRDLRGLELVKRKAKLRKLVEGRHSSIGYIAYIEGAGMAFYREALKLGMEGVIAKDATSHYVAGRTRLWLKSTPEGTHEGWKRPLRSRKGDAA